MILTQQRKFAVHAWLVHRVEGEEGVGKAEREDGGRNGDVEAGPGGGDGGQVVPPAAPGHLAVATLEAGGELEEGEARGHSAHGPGGLEPQNIAAWVIREADPELLRGVVRGVGGLPRGGGQAGAAGEGEKQPGREAKRNVPDAVLLTPVPVMIL